MGTQIIAEIGKNWIYTKEELSAEENLKRAKLLVKSAYDSGSRICKFQCHRFADEIRKRSKDRHDWIIRNEKATPYYDFWKPLKEYCDDLSIEFLCTPMSKEAVVEMDPLVKRWKVGSADITDMDMLKAIGDTKKPVILSTGMSTMQEIKKALKIFKKQEVTLMHCVSIYPCPLEKINLSTIRYLEKTFSRPMGFSDHTLSISVPMFAVACGAKIVEKHFTLNREAFGPDHKVSLLPDEFHAMVESIRFVDTLMGEEVKTLYNEEKDLWKKFRV